MSLYKAAALPLTDDARQLFPGTVAMDVLAFGRFASTGTTAPAVIELSPLWPRFLLSASYADQFKHSVCHLSRPLMSARWS